MYYKKQDFMYTCIHKSIDELIKKLLFLSLTLISCSNHFEKPKGLPVEISYLKDYQKPEFIAETIYITIELLGDSAIITNNMKIKQIKSGKSNKLVLNGRDQELLSVKLNNQEISSSSYLLTDKTLTLNVSSDNLEVTIVSRISPQKNSALEGFFKSGELYLTQCEPHGFSKITYAIDRPDVMSIFTTRLIASKEFPILLSNGDKIEEGELDNSRHYAVWHDKSKKPSYLFAAVVGNLSFKEDFFITKSGKKVNLRIYVENKDLNKIYYAMESLKSAMKWDEKVFNREYDLDTYMIVGTPQFNAGAMENKGLNIFNTKYILADKDTATDYNFMSVHDVVGHEYFHNWTGNRITIRNWFQLCLKEGLTVFREQEFSADEFDRNTKRINDANFIRTVQFQEDAGALSHPVQPNSYIKIDNFYTYTVYEKGAEVIRMLKTILGSKVFYKGMDIFFNKYDGHSITIDEFLKSMEEAKKEDNNINLEQFKEWYTKAGTPKVSINGEYDQDKLTYKVIIKQDIRNTDDNEKARPFLIPIRIGLIGQKSEKPLDFIYKGTKLKEALILHDKYVEQYEFENVTEAPIPSLMRDFSAPIKVEFPYKKDELLLLFSKDANSFSRWNAGQEYLKNVILELIDNIKKGEKTEIDISLIEAFKDLLENQQLDNLYKATLLEIPSEMLLHEAQEVIYPDETHRARIYVIQSIGKNLKNDFLDIYNSLDTKLKNINYNLDKESIAARAFKNICLKYIYFGDKNLGIRLAIEQLKSSDNLTDRIAALEIVSNISDNKIFDSIINEFLDQWKHEELVIDKWFKIQAMSERVDTLDIISKLMNHPLFDIKTPNRIYSLMDPFSMNYSKFHAIDGSGYRLYTDFIIKLDDINPEVAAKLMKAFENWKKIEPNRSKMALECIKRIKNKKNLSDNLNEILVQLIGH